MSLSEVLNYFIYSDEDYRIWKPVYFYWGWPLQYHFIVLWLDGYLALALKRNMASVAVWLRPLGDVNWVLKSSAATHAVTPV